MSIETIEEAYGLLRNGAQINFDVSFDLARFCGDLLRIEDSESVARDLIIRALDAQKRFPRETQILWNDVIEVAGLYPYVQNEQLTGSSQVRYEFHKSAHLRDIYFHAEQAQVASELRSGRSVVASAPTSFGKSLLIDEIVASLRYRNLVVIQPTLALLDETRKRFRRFEDNYHLVLSTSQVPSEAKGNLFLFTAERVVEYREFPPIEFFVIDEFYKLSLDRADDRAIVLNQAFYKLLKHTKTFYLLGPSISSVPTQAEAGLRYHFFPSKFATVATEEIALATNLRANTEAKRTLLFNTLDSLTEPTIIYCASPNGATGLAKEYGAWLGDNPSLSTIRPVDIAAMQEWIGDNIAPEWCLYTLLGKGIGFHHGGLPRHLGSAIVDSFNGGSINYLFCTSTLIEGVNTTAKNIVLYDKKKGTRAIDYFDFRNIAGRAGRMVKHYIGHVYKFENAPEQLDLHVDFPILTQINAPTELLMTMDDEDLRDEGRAKVAQYSGVPADLKEVIRENPALPLDGQLKIVELIRAHAQEWHSDLSWRSFPDYPKLLKVIQLAWDHLRRPNEGKGGVVSAAQLTTLTLNYSALRSVRAVIRSQSTQQFWISREPDLAARVDSVVFQILSVTRHWWDYKLPTFLMAVSNLQRYAFEKENLRPGDYSAFSSQIENGFLQKRFSDLAEYGIPRSAILKIAQLCPHDESVEAILLHIRQLGIERFGFTRYESTKSFAITLARSRSDRGLSKQTTPMIPDTMPTDSAIARRRRLYAMIRKEELGDQIIQELIPNGLPHEYEKQLWDYKRELPVRPTSPNPPVLERKQLELKMAEIVKDAVSFYNSYGGYLVIGVGDNPRAVIGWDKGFDCDELNKKIKGATKHAVDCHFVTREISTGAASFKVGLLFIPQRQDDRSPAQFLKDAPESDTGRRAYSNGDILFRDGHECRPARTADELTFLCSQRRRQIVAPKDEVGFTSVLDNNLGSRDPGFVKFIGRRALLSDLWRWLCDRYTPVKVLAGLGGVGKTTLAREFAENIVCGSPMGFERVIWLSAKKRLYAPGLNDYVLATRVDFSDTDSLLRALLLQLGYNEESVGPEWSRAALIDEVISALRIIPSFLVIDDVDTLDSHDQQSELFHTILQIIDRTVDGPQAASRAILTARLTLGAAAAQLMRVVGLEPKDFNEYVDMTAKAMGLPEGVLEKRRRWSDCARLQRGPRLSQLPYCV